MMLPDMLGRDRLREKQRWNWRTRVRGKTRNRVLAGPRKRLPGLLPTLLTLLNGVCGLISIAVATRAVGDLPLISAAFFAALLIFLGMLFDMLDGLVARGLKQASPFGAQLDSLCDAITFGVAPVFVLLAFHDLFHSRFLFGIGVAYTAAVLLRLARFNVESAQAKSHKYFVGLPSPAAAGTIASFGLARPGLENWTEPTVPVPIQLVGTTVITFIMIALPLLTLLLGWLMVSRVRYRHIVDRWVGHRYRFPQLSRAVLVIIAVLVVHELAVPLVFCLYTMEPVFEALWKKCHTRKQRIRTDGRLIATSSSSHQGLRDDGSRDTPT